MDNLTIKKGNNKISIKKSKKFVGIKTKGHKSATDIPVVKEQLLPNVGGFELVKFQDSDQSVDTLLDEVRNERDVDLGTHVYYMEGSNHPMIPTGEIYIVFNNKVSAEEQQVVLDEYHLTLVERRSPSIIIAKVSKDSPNPVKTAHFLNKIGMVQSAQPDLDTYVDEYSAVALPSDPLLPHEWHLRNPGKIYDANYKIKRGADAKVIDAWNRLGNMGSPDITIAVIDNGFDLSHPDLQGNIVKPFDLWNDSSHITQGDPRFDHGTPCASVAIAPANGSGIVGVAPNSKFMPINGTSYGWRATEKMFDYCIQNGADVVSCSWGSVDPAFDLDDIKKAAIHRAATKGRNGKGCVIVYAGGNEGENYLNFYAQHPNVIAVAASTSKDEHATYSNKGRHITVCAPSNGDWPIIAARASWDEGTPFQVGARRYWFDGISRGDRYKHFGGTSSAAPLVAGVCALILSANPDLTAAEVKQILIKTADKIGDPNEYMNGYSTKFGYGRVNADRAVAEAFRMKDGFSPDPSTGTTDTPFPGSDDGDDTSGSTTAPDTGIPPTHTGGSTSHPVVKSGEGLFRFSVSRQPSQGFGVQVFAFADYGNVLIKAEEIEKRFDQPVIVNINKFGGRTVFKVIVGSFGSIDDARSLQRRLENAGIKGFIRNLSTLK